MSSTPSLPANSARPKAFLWQYGLILAFVLLFSALLFTFFHEGGHALVGLVFGAKITSFSVDFLGMSAHVGLDASFPPLQQAFVSLAGFSLPLLLVIAFLLSVPRRTNAVLEWTKMLTAIISISSVLAWIVLPWIYLSGGRPGDDSITFLMVTGFPPALVSAGAAVIFGGSLAVFFNRVDGPKGILACLRAEPVDLITPATRRTLAAMGLVFFSVAGLALGLGTIYGTAKSNFLAPPAEYSLAAKIELSRQALAGEPVYSISLAQPASVSLFFAMDGLTHGPGKISLTGPNGNENIFYMDNEQASGNFTVHSENLKLAAGPYQVVLTFPQDPGVLTIYQIIDPAESIQSNSLSNRE